MDSVSLIFSTFPDESAAREICIALVDSAMIACATLLPHSVSIYMWDGERQQTTEVQVIMKTSSARTPEVVSQLSELHPYDVPEILVVEAADGLPSYISWVLNSTSPVR